MPPVVVSPIHSTTEQSLYSKQIKTASKPIIPNSCIEAVYSEASEILSKEQTATLKSAEEPRRPYIMQEYKKGKVRRVLCVKKKTEPVKAPSKMGFEPCPRFET